jgi:HK97 family phage major capsid protein
MSTLFRKAFSVLEVKAVDDEQREITGIASTPSVDRMGDIVEPMGAKFKTPMPLLLYHNSEKPVGNVTFAKPTKSGIPFRASLPKVSEPGTIKDRVDEAWHSLKYKLLGAVSIGFSAEKGGYEPLKDGGIRFTSWNWLELSLVAIPAQPDAVITGIKSIDTRLRAASGTSPPSVSTPASPGNPNQPASSGFFYSRSNEMKTLKELMELRTTKVSRMEELVKSIEDGTANQDESGEYDTISDEIGTLDNEIRVAKLHQIKSSAAKPVETRGPTVFARKQDPEDKFAGQSFVRIQIAKALALAHNENPIAIAHERWGKSHPKLVEHLKALVPGGGTGSGEWGAELAQTDARFTGDFIEYLYGQTVFDQLGLRSIPSRVKVKGQDGAFTGYWVGESKAIPASAGSYSDVDLSPLKVAGLAVISMELLEDSQPSAEMLVRDGLVEASSQRVDTTFLSASAASAGVSPAGILNGVTPLVPSGTDLAAVRADFQALIYPFVQGKMGTGITLVMNPATALALSFMYGTLDQRAFPEVNQTGGSLNGMRVVVGDNVTPGDVIAIRTSDVWRIGDSGIRISMSREATIEQRDDPTGATDTPVGVTTTGLTSMFQEESIAFKVVRRINFQKRRSNAVQYLSNVEWGGVTS